VLLGETSPHVEHWYDATVRIATLDPASDAFDRSVAELIAAITSSPTSDATTGVGLDGADTIATLLAALDEETLEVRSRAAVLLSFLHGSQLDQAQLRSVTDVLAGALSARDSEIAHSALRSIGALGPRAIAATPALARFLRSNASPTLRAQATIALNRVGPTAEAAEALAAAATDFRSGIQLAAVTQLGEWGRAASAAVPALTWLADTDDTHLRIVTLTALGSIGDPTIGALVAVLEAIASDEAQLHHVGLRTLSQMTPLIDQLARALVSAKSWAVKNWLRERWPAPMAALAAGMTAEDRLTAASEVAQALLAGARMLY